MAFCRSSGIATLQGWTSKNFAENRSPPPESGTAWEPSTIWNSSRRSTVKGNLIYPTSSHLRIMIRGGSMSLRASDPSESNSLEIASLEASMPVVPNDRMLMIH
eukprot:1319058-Amorphochlora_amoeboformis.AAC.1